MTFSAPKAKYNSNVTHLMCSAEEMVKKCGVWGGLLLTFRAKRLADHYQNCFKLGIVFQNRLFSSRTNSAWDVGAMLYTQLFGHTVKFNHCTNHTNTAYW